MEFNMLYLVGCVITFIAIMTGLLIYKFVTGESIDLPEVFIIVFFYGAVSAIWFVVIPILVLSCVNFLLSKLIIKLFNVGGTK